MRIDMTTASGAPGWVYIPRGVIGGVLMGLANLVPGISGGTMLLAAGVYPLFITAIAELTRFRFRLFSFVLLGAVVVSAGLAILLFAGAVKNLVVDHRWVMYSLFIGLTLGGIPVVWKLARPATPATWAGAVGGFLAMGALALLQQSGAVGGGDEAGVLLFFLAGLAGASAMILPGISGGYLLLVLGVYVPLLTAIDGFKDALQARDIALLIDLGLRVIVPVGLGVLAGVVGISNLLSHLLKRYAKATTGALIGLLAGAVIGLWPFQEGVQPQVGEIFKGRVVTVERLETIDPEDYPTEFFKPTTGQVAGSLGVVLLGLLATSVIAKMEK